MNRWQITGLLATVVIILSVPLYVLRVKNITPSQTAPQSAEFVGRDNCASCHEVETEKWRNSDHDRAMDVAGPKTVLGNFDNAIFEHKGIRSRFFRKGDDYYVNTQGPEGKMANFKITHTFGHTPLQQYLIPFENGRLQCLPIAWDVVKKQWYQLNPDETLAPSDWLHWSRQSANWNSMCAECHSTRLQKNYNPETDSYHTSWSEIDVSCETCHGPGSLHAAWADLPELARPDIDNYGLVVDTKDLPPEQQITVCARCHSRRIQLGDFNHGSTEVLDYIIPELLTEGLYHPDGQILDEVYVYGSFVQSKMYHNNVRCSDCHDVHSGQRLLQGNDLCLQCHRTDVYNAKSHHFHRKTGEEGEPLKDATGQIISGVGEGAECVRCHMPGQTYMGIDNRADHSIRIPRPDLSLSLKTPNACNQCHVNETPEWADKHITSWYGQSRKPHYGTVLANGRNRKPGAQKDLIRLADDTLLPVIVRATSLQLLGSYSDKESRQAFDQALNDEQALIRYTAVRYINSQNPELRKRQLLPLLDDPVRAVRMECAMSLSTIPIDRFNATEKDTFDRALAEYKAVMTYSADFTFSGLNLGNLYYYLGKQEESERQYRRAIRIAMEFNPAKLNLAVLLSGQGKNKEAEKLLQQVVASEPESWEAHYKLGLLLVEQKNISDAVTHLEKAAKGFGTRPRIYYNLGLLYQRLENNGQAEAALLKAVALAPGNADYLYGATYFYFSTGRYRKAKQLAEKLSAQHPANPLGKKMLDLIERRLAQP